MDTKLNGYGIVGVILIIISTISLLAGNLIGELWPITEKLFEGSIIGFMVILSIIFLSVGIKKQQQTH